MKTAVALAAVLGLSASQVAAQGKARWVEVVSDSAEVISIDASTVTPVGEDSVYRVWERSVSHGSNDLRVLARADFDCRLRLTRVIAVQLAGFAPVAASEDEREWTEILPGSRYDAELRQVCSTGGPTGGPR